MTARSPEELREGCLRKLEAEASIGVLAALVAGCAVPASDVVLSPEEAATLHPLFGMLVYFHVTALCLVFAAGMVNVVFTSTMYWAGMKIFSKRKGSIENDLTVFDAWWDSIKHTRQTVRNAFLYSVPLLLVAVASSPGFWKQSPSLAAINAVILGLSAIGCVVLVRGLVLGGTPKQNLGKKAD